LDTLGNVHVAWLDVTNYDLSGTDHDIFCKRWNATTRAWSTTEVVSTESNKDSLFPSIGLDNLGNLHIVWQDITNYGGSGADIDIFYKMWNATTGTWSTTEMVSKESFNDSEHPSIGVDGLGNVHVVWRDLTDYHGSGTDMDIFYKQLLYNNTAPEITINSPGTSDFFGAIPPDFNISIIEPHLDCTWYTINNGIINITFSGITGTINQSEWDAKESGLVTIRFYAIDALGKLGYSEVIVQKDITAPNTSVFFIPHSGIDVVNESTVLSFTADDGLGSGVSLIRFRINYLSWIIYSSPFTLTSYPYGDILILYQAVDQVNNYEIIQMLVLYRTDTIAPASLISFTPYTDPDIVIKSTVFTLTADDGLGSGALLIRYKINDSSWIPYTVPFNLSIYDYGEYMITYQAIDVIGNIEIEHTILIFLVPESSSQSRIPGYNLILLLGILSVVAIIMSQRIKKP